MYRLPLITLALFGFFAGAPAQKKEYMPRSERFKWEIRGGINASVPHLSELYIDGIETSNTQEIGKVGLYASVSMRYHIKRFFLQPEASYSYTHGASSFSFIENEIEYGGQQIAFKKHSLDIPLFFGYNFIQKKPYVMSLYLGPQFIYNFVSNYYFNDMSVTTDEDPYKANIIIGVGAHISHLSLNFRYSVDPYKTRTTHHGLSLGDDRPPVSFNYGQRINTISFAIGYQF